MCFADLLVDASNPEQPRQLGYFPMVGIAGSSAFGAAATDIAVVGNLVYLAAADKGLYILDVSDPRKPTLVGSLDMLDNTSGVATAGPTLATSRLASKEQPQMKQKVRNYTSLTFCFSLEFLDQHLAAFGSRAIAGVEHFGAAESSTIVTVTVQDTD